MVDYVKYLMWLPILAAPFIVFAATPKTPPAWRIGRLLAVVVLLYVGYSLAAHHMIKSYFDRVDVVQEQSDLCPGQTCVRRPKMEQSQQEQTRLLLDLLRMAWPLLLYVSMTELAWRLWHWKELRASHQSATSVLFSSCLIIAAVLYPVLTYLDTASALGHFKALRAFSLKFAIFLDVFSPDWVMDIYIIIVDMIYDIIWK